MSILQSRVTFLGISVGGRFLKLKIELLLPKESVTCLVSANLLPWYREQSSERAKSEESFGCGIAGRNWAIN